ncbi:putative sporulation protein YtxC [Paenibacillus taiwanensis]|uniref:putative sporulation protein YtxC n=1 Tax=Paenibacillus taiwanensis TaxID=401638 RepID=UPI0004111EE0|nr:putative sporulation protein YtxC [Paenibacillus taiwanensis]
MELFTVSIPSAQLKELESLTELLKCEMGDLHTSSSRVTLDTFQTDKLAGVTCSGLLPEFQLHVHGQDVWKRAASAVAEYILAVKEGVLIRSLIAKEKHVEDADRNKIEAYCYQLLNGYEEQGSPEVRRRRKSKVTKALQLYLEEHTVLNVDGFIRFRLESYMTELREVVDYAIDEYVLERQYQEFISLLKYFVYIQDTKIPMAHLMHKGCHEFTLLDEQWLPIEPSHVVDGMIVEMIDCDMEMEDMIVSTLINVSPGHIVIHTRDPESQVIKTIQQIFEARVHVCVYCNSCEPCLTNNWKSQDLVP